MESNKAKLINDIQQLLNTYEDLGKTSIDPSLLEFMDENTLKSIIDSLLTQKENTVESDREWLETFKKTNE